MATPTPDPGSPDAAPTAAPTPTSTYDGAVAELVKKVNSSAGWLFVVAGLSLINTVLALSGSDRTFLFGVTITMIIDGIASAVVDGQEGPLVIVTRVIEFGCNMVVMGILIALGILGRRAKTWAFVTAVVLYGLDTLLTAGLALLDSQLWITAGIHVFVLFVLVNGLLNCRKLNALATQRAMAALAPQA